MFCEKKQSTLEEASFELGGHEAPCTTWLAGHQLLSEVNLFSKSAVASFPRGAKHSTTSAGEF